MKKLWLITISAVVGWGIIIALSMPLYAQVKGAPLPFSAQWAYFDEGERMDGGQYYAASDAVRVEMSADRSVHHLGPDGGPYAVIYNLKDRIAWVLDHTKCTYSKQNDIRFGMFWNNRIGQFGSPCPKDTRSRRIGRDTLQGRSVEKWRCTYPERHQIVVWYDTRLQTPIRIDIDEDFDEFFELTNIEEGPPPETLFVPPPEYVAHDLAILIEPKHTCP